MRGFLVALVLPPVGPLLLGLLGALLALRGSRRGAWLAAGSSLLLLVLAMPLVAALLTRGLERAIPPPATGAPPAAIIVLGAEVARGQGGLEPGPLTLERMRAAARLAHRSGLPVLASGGRIQRTDAQSLADIMAGSLEQDFGIAVRWREAASRDTHENAARSAAMLRAEGIGAAWLVTHSWHMARAAEAFAREGFAVHPAPVRLLREPHRVTATDFLPQAEVLHWNWLMLREWAGRLVYALRDG